MQVQDPQLPMQVHMVTGRKLVGPKRAAVLSLVAMLPLLEHWTLRIVEVWRAANILGGELLSDYLSRSVPHAERKHWWRYAPACWLQSPWQ